MIVELHSQEVNLAASDLVSHLTGLLLVHEIWCIYDCVCVVLHPCRQVTDVSREVGDIAQSTPYIVRTGRAGFENVQHFIACERLVIFESIINECNH